MPPANRTTPCTTFPWPWSGTALVATAAERFGGLHAAFNVAGASRPGLLVDLSEEDWDFTVDLCLKGVFFGVKHAGRQMIAGVGEQIGITGGKVIDMPGEEVGAEESLSMQAANGRSLPAISHVPLRPQPFEH